MAWGEQQTGIKTEGHRDGQTELKSQTEIPRQELERYWTWNRDRETQKDMGETQRETERYRGRQRHRGRRRDTVRDGETQAETQIWQTIRKTENQSRTGKPRCQSKTGPEGERQAVKVRREEGGGQRGDEGKVQRRGLPRT